MNREWLAFIEGVEQGPYAAKELGAHPQVTPDTFVRKKNWNKWVPIRQVFELREIFKDKPVPQPTDDQNISEKIDLNIPDDTTLALTRPDPFPPYIWWILLLFFSIYLFYLFMYE